MKKKKKNDEKQFLWYPKLALILLGLGLIFGANRVTVINLAEPLHTVGESDFGNNMCPTEEQHQLENIAGFELPQSTHNLYAFCSWTTTARFDMSPDDLDTFLESTLFELPLASEGELEYVRLPETVSLDDMDSYLFGQHGQNDYFAEILIDTSNPDVYTVYIEVLGG